MIRIFAVFLLACCLQAAAFPSRADSVTGFRDLFAASAKRRNPTLTTDDLHKLFLYPTPNLLPATKMASLEEVDKAFRQSRPSDLIAEGMTTPFGVVDPLAPFAARAATGARPITIVVINGMNGEFLPKMAFQAVYNNRSALARAFAEALAKTRESDVVFDLTQYKDIEMPLDQLVTAGSVETENGTALYQVVWLRQHEGSLESLTMIEKVVPRLASRLNKFLKLVGGMVDDFVVLGYSRGAIDAFEFMAKREEYGWGNRLRGLITHNGVNFGSELGDCVSSAVISTPPVVCQELTIAASLLSTLRDKLVPKRTHFVQNLDVFGKAISTLAGVAVKLPTIPQLNGTKVVFPDLYKTWDQLLKGILELFDIRHPVADYDNNIRRIQALTGAFADSMYLLSTKGRLEWFRQHTLPVDAFYLAFTSTMSDYDVNEPLMHPDVYAVRQSYYINRAAGASEICDGQLSAGRELIIPRIHMAVNANQKEYESQWLGVAYADHLGVAIDDVVPCPDGWQNPFPRPPLIDSLAAWSAMNTV